MTAAPAAAAATDSSAICPGVIGKYGDIVGVCIPPVMAQVMMTLSARFMGLPSRQGFVFDLFPITVDPRERGQVLQHRRPRGLGISGHHGRQDRLVVVACEPPRLIYIAGDQ